MNMQRRIVQYLLAALLVCVSTLAHAATCEKLKKFTLPDAKIVSSELVAAGTFTMSNPVTPQEKAAGPVFKSLPAFCRVVATLTPSPGSQIKVEVWMPAAGWNGRFLGVGNGGWAGTISYPALADGVRQGFATASTDDGTAGLDHANPSSWQLLEDRDILINFGYRATHLMTVTGKAATTVFYGKAPVYSYWNSCSTGGMQGLSEAQRFPEDYNAIMEGDPANYFTHLMFGIEWPGIATLKDPASYIPPAKYPVIHQAAIAACDALDGLKDGIINDPRICHFDPQVLACREKDASDCLTPPQVIAARKIYAGATNPRTGEQIFPGLMPGSELGWGTQAAGPQPQWIGVVYFSHALFKDPNWDWKSLNFDSDVATSDRQLGTILNAVNPNLKAFKAHGGKLVMFHGWSDFLISPLNSINYYNSVVAAMDGAEKTEDFARLFMIPGMGHCGGGPGPDGFNRIDVLEQWVEHGHAPDRIIATHSQNGTVDMTRPLCPYPQIAQWSGKGSTSDAANFSCVRPSAAQ